MSLRVSHFVVGLACLCFAASIAYCAPTISEREVLVPDSLTLDNSAELVYQINSSLGSKNNKLSDLGTQLLKPPTETSSVAQFTNSQLKSLPAVPAAVFMGICGFLCVSLVKDRRFWMTGLAAMLWVGQTGLANLPRLAQRLAHSNRVHSAKEFQYACLPDDLSRLRSDLEGTEYIGLLHHLGGIPGDNHRSSLNQSANPAGFDSHQRLQSEKSGFVERKGSTLLLALYRQEHRFDSLFKCLEFNARQHPLFSPAFIFSSLSRGPPQSALISFHTVIECNRETLCYFFDV